MVSKNKSLSEAALSRGRAAVALSGGLDSSVLLAFCSRELGSENCMAFTARSPYMVASETRRAVELCAKTGVECVVLDFEMPGFLRKNPPDRCYLCKRMIFSKIIGAARARGFGHVFDGTNADDLSDYRPGMCAASELGIESPFLECGMGKAEIRALAAELGVPCVPASPCLLTRFEHGAFVSEERLRAVEKAEDYLKSIGFGGVRVRLHGGCARIEIDGSDFEKFCGRETFSAVDAKLKSLGFGYASLDLHGYSRGSMNKKDEDS